VKEPPAPAQARSLIQASSYLEREKERERACVGEIIARKRDREIERGGESRAGAGEVHTRLLVPVSETSRAPV
jgi:hypothetical protein